MCVAMCVTMCVALRIAVCGAVCVISCVAICVAVCVTMCVAIYVVNQPPTTHRFRLLQLSYLTHTDSAYGKYMHIHTTILL